MDANEIENLIRQYIMEKVKDTDIESKRDIKMEILMRLVLPYTQDDNKIFSSVKIYDEIFDEVYENCIREKEARIKLNKNEKER